LVRVTSQMATLDISLEECPICKDTFDKNEHQPLTLMCCHVICRTCVVDCTNSLELYGPESVTCPMCNVITDATTKFKKRKNFDYLAPTIQHLKHKLVILCELQEKRQRILDSALQYAIDSYKHIYKEKTDGMNSNIGQMIDEIKHTIDRSELVHHKTGRIQHVKLQNAGYDPNDSVTDAINCTLGKFENQIKSYETKSLDNALYANFLITGEKTEKLKLNDIYTFTIVHSCSYKLNIVKLCFINDTTYVMTQNEIYEIDFDRSLCMKALSSTDHTQWLSCGQFYESRTMNSDGEICDVTHFGNVILYRITTERPKKTKIDSFSFHNGKMYELYADQKVAVLSSKSPLYLRIGDIFFGFDDTHITVSQTDHDQVHKQFHPNIVCMYPIYQNDSYMAILEKSGLLTLVDEKMRIITQIMLYDTIEDAIMTWNFYHENLIVCVNHKTIYTITIKLAVTSAIKSESETSSDEEEDEKAEKETKKEKEKAEKAKQDSPKSPSTSESESDDDE
jgi:hypothetical protein